MSGVEWFGSEDALMAYITWTGAYNIGVPAIDEEHRGLVDIGNHLHDRLYASAPDAEIDRIFERLTDCTTMHCRNEEKLFVGTDYPRATIHARKHQHLLVILACFLKGFDRTGKRVSFADQLNFLRDWVLDHIATEDRHLGDYLIAQESAKPLLSATP
jgi:hemerythrin-like metal-binding protein